MRTTWLTRLAGTENSGCGFQIIIGNRSSLVCVRVKRVEKNKGWKWEVGTIRG